MTKGGLSITFLLIGLVGGLVLVADLWVKNAPEPASAGGSPSESVPSSTSAGASSPPTLDGVIEKGEYAHAFHDQTTGMDLSWSIVGDKIYFGLHSPGQGWLAVGLAPDGPAMKGAEILMGYVQDGKASMQDEFGDTSYSHKPDTEAGGTDDIIQFAGSEDANGTTLEFERPLNPGGTNQKAIVSGPMTVMFAYSSKDDWTSYHRHRNEAQIDFFAPEGGG